MPRPARAAVLDRLRDTIDAIEKRAPLPRAREAVTAFPFARLPEDGVHEIFVPGFRDAAPGLAFAMGHAAARLSQARPAMFWIHLAHETQETGVPYAPGLAPFGLAPDDLVLIRAETASEMLWAAEEAASCRAVAAVIVDVLVPPKALDFTASRRLALRTGATGVPVFVLRYGEGREASAARTRWRIAPAASPPHPHDASAPGEPLWQATLEKAPNGQAGQWQLAWTGTHFTEHSSSPSAPRLSHGSPGSAPAPQPAARPAPSRPHLSALGHRLPATG